VPNTSAQYKVLSCETGCLGNLNTAALGYQFIVKWHLKADVLIGSFISTGIQKTYATSKAGSEELHLEIKHHNLNKLIAKNDCHENNTDV